MRVREVYRPDGENGALRAVFLNLVAHAVAHGGVVVGEPRFVVDRDYLYVHRMGSPAALLEGVVDRHILTGARVYPWNGHVAHVVVEPVQVGIIGYPHEDIGGAGAAPVHYGRIDGDSVVVHRGV